MRGRLKYASIGIGFLMAALLRATPPPPSSLSTEMEYQIDQLRPLEGRWIGFIRSKEGSYKVDLRIGRLQKDISEFLFYSIVWNPSNVKSKMDVFLDSPASKTGYIITYSRYRSSYQAVPTGIKGSVIDISDRSRPELEEVGIPITVKFDQSISRLNIIRETLNHHKEVLILETHGDKRHIMFNITGDCSGITCNQKVDLEYTGNVVWRLPDNIN